MKVLNLFNAKLDKVNVWFMRIGFIAIIGMLAVDSINVISLKMGAGAVIPSGKELIEELMIITVYCGVAYVHLRQQDIKTEILVRRFSPGLRFGADIFSQLTVISICILLLWRSIALLQATVIEGATKQGVISVPQFPSRLIITIAFLLLLASALLVLAKIIKTSKKGAKT